jgi:SAM-dependent methyltransferase
MSVAEMQARDTYDAMARFYDRFTAHHRAEEWAATLEGMARKAGLSGRRMLDVACGTGKSFLPYLERGYDVTACDVSPAMAEIATAKADGRARVLVADMRRLPRLGEFDLVACIDDAVNYLLTYDELAATLTGLRRQLAPGGVVVFDTNTLLAYREFYARATVVPDEAQVLVWEGRESPEFAAGGVAHATLTALCRGEDDWWTRTEIEHVQRHYPEREVRAALEAAGLECAAVYGMHLDGSTDEGFDEMANSKAVYIARASAQGEEGR